MTTQVAPCDSSMKPANTGPETAPVLTQNKAPAACAPVSYDVQPTDPLLSESAIDSPTSDDYVDESAIDDDDSSDWEDSTEQVPKELQQQASHSASAIIALGASPNDKDDGPPMMTGVRPSNIGPVIEVPRSSTQPTVAQAVLSPQTTRRNMFATELTKSLRRHLLWERQQRTSTANAVLRRRHASHDVANLRQFPEKPCLKQSEDANASWNQHLITNAFDGYHSRGW
ncbi:hypothetical protein ISF_09745 [Cordyceps fumosorosea ARSEF 2679]|uniref:DUF3295 domain-containing protein n=1 Tax=Cordyceps fumosorosea (strain ARSEF 2679) TaxID=1081104 RepID=A0A167D7W1_CORFA|nr:hypothetical protein ISF_09745 [Cordyceps fumosorosea ARSEF 2679]OAA42050.1 hypothetical protein ISF_09745 [Cordyceps fumosorosea ARSEF 2679]